VEDKPFFGLDRFLRVYSTGSKVPTELNPPLPNFDPLIEENVRQPGTERLATEDIDLDMGSP
jgi:hypothetical protein